MYYCYICEFSDDDYDSFITVTIDWNSELVCVECEGNWQWKREEDKD